MIKTIASSMWNIFLSWLYITFIIVGLIGMTVGNDVEDSVLNFFLGLICGLVVLSSHGLVVAARHQDSESRDALIGVMIDGTQKDLILLEDANAYIVAQNQRIFELENDVKELK